MLKDDSIELLAAAFMNRASQHDGNALLYIKRRADLAPLFKQIFGISLSSDEADTLLAKLIQAGVFSEVSDRFTKGFIHVTGNVRQISENLSQQDGTPYYYANRLGREWLDEALASFELRSELTDPNAELVSAIAPAADRLVTLNHNSAELREVVELTVTADELVRGSNTADPDKISWIREHIALGIKLLGNRKVILSAVSALLLKPLLSAYDAVSEEPAKLAIQAAITAIRHLFGI